MLQILIAIYIYTITLLKMWMYCCTYNSAYMSNIPA